jgi:hypothetical protein
MDRNLVLLSIFSLLAAHPASASGFFPEDMAASVPMGGTLGFGTSNSGTSELTVQVYDEFSLAPLPNAQVQITNTDSSTPTQTVSATLDGYASTTVIGVTSNQVSIFLKQIPTASDPTSVMSGTMGDYTVAPDSSLVRAGLVFRVLSASDLLDFSPTCLVSPLKDTINAFGSRQIPSNVVLPKQDVSVFPLSLSLDKALYRFPLPSGRPARLASLQGEIDASSLVKAFMSSDGASSWASLIDQMSLSRVGVTDAITPSADTTLDAPTSLDLTPVHQVMAPAPPFAAETLLIAVTDLNGDRQSLIPTDVKTTGGTSNADGAREAVTLRSTADNLGQDRDVLAIATDTNGERLTGVYIPQAGPQVTVEDFLPVDELADYTTAPTTISLQAPDQGIAQLSFSHASAAQLDGTVSLGSQIEYPYAYVYVLPAAGAVNIPTVGTPDGYAITQLAFTAGFDTRLIDAGTALQSLERFTRSEARLSTGN